MLQYQHSTVKVLATFVAQPDADALPDPLTGKEPVEYFLGSDWKVKKDFLDICILVELNWKLLCLFQPTLQPNLPSFIDWQVDVTNLVRYSLKVSDPDVARVQDGVLVQGRAVGATTIQVGHEVWVRVWF